jgi:hypothetical protein
MVRGGGAVKEMPYRKGDLVCCRVHHVYYPTAHPGYTVWLADHLFCAMPEYGSWENRMACFEGRTGNALHLSAKADIPEHYTCPLSFLEQLAFVGQTGDLDGEE